MTHKEALIALNLFGEIGSIRLKKLLEYFHKPENIFKAPRDKLTKIFGIGEKIVGNILAFKKEDLDKELALAAKFGLKILTEEDREYPQNLKNIPDPPIVLYVKGELQEEDKISIGIVGSRRASFYGLSSALEFAAGLSRSGFTIISGMARGIDTYAHKGALKNKGRTIAVMGSGFNNIYPPENKELAAQIASNGAVISEFPLNTEPFKQNFPRRNRVISGLSLGVLVVEAARNSGALITADFALEQGREVFALPGKIDARTSFGTNGLIKQGAKLVASIEDILEEFNLVPVKENPWHQDKPQALSLASKESLLYNMISSAPLLLDEIIENSGLDASSVLDTLLKLELKKLIRQLPGRQFIRN